MMTEEDDVRKIVRMTLEEAGLGTTTPAERQELREDFIWLRGWRKSAQAARRHAFLTAIAVLVSGFLGWLWLTYKPN